MGYDQSNNRSDSCGYDVERTNIQDIDFEGDTPELPDTETNPPSQQIECQPAHIAAHQQVEDCPEEGRQYESESERWARHVGILVLQDRVTAA